MADTSDLRLEFLEFGNELSGSAENWHTIVGDYIVAYNNAQKSYTKTLKEQKDWDELKAKLLIVATTTVIGSTAVLFFGSASVGVLAEDAALEVICRNNLEMAFKGLYSVRTSAPAMFALGILADEAQTEIKNMVYSAARQMMTYKFIVDPDSDPLNESQKLHGLVSQTTSCTRFFAAAVGKNESLTPDRKRAILAQLREAPIMKPPDKQANGQQLQDRIELCLYMATLLNSDYLREVYGTDEFGRFILGEKKPITVSPTSTDYPSTWPHSIPGKMVDIEDPGSVVRERIDVLFSRMRLGLPSRFRLTHPRVPSGPSFYRQANWLPETTLEDLKRAQHVLETVGRLSRPTLYNSLRFESVVPGKG